MHFYLSSSTLLFFLYNISLKWKESHIKLEICLLDVQLIDQMEYSFHQCHILFG